MNIQPPRMGPQPRPQVRTARPAASVQHYAGDALLPRTPSTSSVSRREYARRYWRCAPRDARSTSSDCLIGRAAQATGASAAACVWLSGHWAMARARLSYGWFRSMASRTMIYSMAARTREACRRPVRGGDQGPSGTAASGRYARLDVERIRDSSSSAPASG